AWWNLLPDLLQLEKYLERPQLNAMFLPVAAAPPVALTSPWLLDDYDLARGRALLRAARRPTAREGPRPTSAREPLSATPLPPERILFQELSRVPASLARAWTSDFLNQAAYTRTGTNSPASRGLRMRTTIRGLATGLGEVRQALGEWISLGGQAQ